MAKKSKAKPVLPRRHAVMRSLYQLSYQAHVLTDDYHFALKTDAAAGGKIKENSKKILAGLKKILVEATKAARILDAALR